MSIVDIEKIACDYRELLANVRELEAQAETLKQELIREMDSRQAEKLRAGAFEIRYNCVESTRLDAAKLKAEQSEVYAAYAKSSVSTRFQVV